jgi:hypothetical protein
MQRKSSKVPEYGDWWQGNIQVPSTAQVVDFVLSDTDRRAWDNNKNRDYHVPVRKALSKEKLIQVIRGSPSPLLNGARLVSGQVSQDAWCPNRSLRTPGVQICFSGRLVSKYISQDACPDVLSKENFII